MTLTQLFTAIANAIRAKTGSSDTIVAEDFPDEIADIPTGIIPTGTKQITQNGTVDVTNYASADVNVSGGSSEFSPDWAELGYEETPQAIIDGFNYAKEIKENWNASVTDLQNKFGSDDNLMYMPIVDTSNVTNMMNMFNNCINLMMFPQLNTGNVTNMMGMFTSCRNLVEIPQIDTSKLTNAMSMCSNCRKLVKVPLINTINLTNAGNMFSSCISLTTVPKLDFRKVTYIYGVFENCRNLSEASLNNILAMCAESNISSASSKTLKQIGLTSDQATTCTGLSNWAACEAAGWTTGY